MAEDTRPALQMFPSGYASMQVWPSVLVVPSKCRQPDHNKELERPTPIVAVVGSVQILPLVSLMPAPPLWEKSPRLHLGLLPSLFITPYENLAVSLEIPSASPHLNLDGESLHAT